VADLVNRTRLALAQTARFVERLLFKEETNLIARREKVFVARARLLVRREDRDDTGIEALNQLFSARTQRRTVRRADEIFEHEKTVSFVQLQLPLFEFTHPTASAEMDHNLTTKSHEPTRKEICPSSCRFV